MTMKLAFSRNNGIDFVEFVGEYKLIRCSNPAMRRCEGLTYGLRLINGRLSALDTGDLEGEGSKEFHTSTVTEVTNNFKSLVVRTHNSVYEFVKA